TYPERATDAKNITKIDKTLIEQNITIIKEFLLSNEIKEIWGAWGDLKYDPLIRGRDEIITMLKQNNIKIFHFSSLTKNGNPRHPLYLKIELQNKNYMEI
ncbi:MAG: DUF1643 domain-containing protein, partial [Lactobacillaceae bacterium]|nr:DUF1643 domain-containing protein [Lactobacillaceae bacterium]